MFDDLLSTAKRRERSVSKSSIDAVRSDYLRDLAKLRQKYLRKFKAAAMQFDDACLLELRTGE